MTHTSDPSDAVEETTQSADDEAILLLADRSRRPDFEDHARAIIERGLAADTPPLVTVRRVIVMLSRYIGSWDAAFALLNLLAMDPSDPYIDDPYAPIDDPDVREHLERVVARLAGLFGHEVQIGLDLGTRHPKDWQYIKVRALYDLESASWTIESTMRQFDQSEVVVAGDPLSMLRLVNHLLLALNNISAQVEGAAALFDEVAIDDFVSSSDDLRSMLSQSQDVHVGVGSPEGN